VPLINSPAITLPLPSKTPLKGFLEVPIGSQFAVGIIPMDRQFSADMFMLFPYL
jgi:hypothetical protein